MQTELALSSSAGVSECYRVRKRTGKLRRLATQARCPSFENRSNDCWLEIYPAL
jgi:hypothetical protein